MSDEARLRIAGDLRRVADQLGTLASPGGCSRAKTLARDAAELAVYATRRILDAANHCPDLLGPLRPGKFGGAGVPLVCPSLNTDADMLRYWIMCALPWLRSIRGGELPSGPITLATVHVEPGKMTAKQRRKLKRLFTAYQRAFDAAAPGQRVDLPAVRRRLDREDPTELDVPPVVVAPEGYDEDWWLDDERRQARYWAAAMRAFAAIIAEQGAPSDKPAWDGAVLRYKGKEVLTIRRTAERRTPLLQAFQNAGWRQTIGYADRGTHLAQTIKDLNKALKATKAPIRFGRSGKGEAAEVSWRPS